MLSGVGAAHDRWVVARRPCRRERGCGANSQVVGAHWQHKVVKVQPQLANVVASDPVDGVGAGPRRSRRQGGGVTHVGNISVVLEQKWGNYAKDPM